MRFRHLIHIDNSVTIGKKMCAKLKELIPRQQFDIPIQAAIGAKIISRETVKAFVKMSLPSVMVEIFQENESF